MVASESASATKVSCFQDGVGPFKLGYRPELDGIRGISILAVMGAHANLINSTFAFVGVDLFFVLSGFLITTLLIEEWNRDQGISLKKFYLRRALRLLPALASMILVVVAYGFFTKPRQHAMEDLTDGLLSLFYCMNWARIYEWDHSGWLMHTWSLSVEEHFYLLWPIMLLLLLRRTAPTALAPVVMLCVFLAMLLRVLLFLGTVTTPIRLLCGSDTRADALLAGCAVATLFAMPAVPQVITVCRKMFWPALSGAAVLVLFGLFTKADKEWMYLAGWFCISACGALIIAHVTAAPHGRMARFLAMPWLVYIGKISYGLYLWHYPVFRLVELQEWPFWTGFAVNGVATAALTLVSYYAIERPFLRMKSSLQPK